MIRSLILLAPFVLASMVQAQSPTVKPVSLQVMPSLDKNDQDVFSLGGTGTSVSVIVATPSKCMVALDKDACKLQSYTDDKGTDLTKSPKTGLSSSRRWIGGSEFQPNETGDRACVSLVTGGTPRAGAKHIAIKGTLRVLCGTVLKTVEQEDVPVVVDPRGDKTKIGDFPVAVFNGGASILVESDQPNVLGVEVLDAAGQAVTVISSRKGKTMFNHKDIYSYVYNLEEAAKSLTVRIAYFNTIETVDIPVDLTIGVGF